MKTSWAVILLLTFLLIKGMLFAQSGVKPEGAGKPDPQLSQKDNDYMDRQAKVFLDSVSRIVTDHPPSFPEDRDRAYAKLLMDAVFHDKFAAYRKPAQDFFHAQTVKLIAALHETRIEKGAMIRKVYNMGFIVSTKSVTLAFDLVSGSTAGAAGFELTTDEISRIVDQCDALFISHRHADHADMKVVRAFIAAGKPVVSPDQVWKDNPLFPKILHPERSADKTWKMNLSGNRVLDVIIFPGHQMAATDNNVTMVTTPEGITIVHLGDQINENDFMSDYEWIDKVCKTHHVDVLITNCWTNDIFRIVKGFNPELVIPGHELELGHTVWDRVPFWGDDEYLELNYRLLKSSECPVVVMIWGESYHYKPD